MPFFDKKLSDKLKGMGMLPGDLPKIDFLPTGIYGLDLAIGGGVPRGRLTEIAGLNQRGKTTTALIMAQKTIEDGGRVAWFEAEQTVDYQWMGKLGIAPEDIYWDSKERSLEETHLHVFHPGYLEGGLQAILELCDTNLYDLIVLDSFGGCPIRSVQEGTMEDRNWAGRARVGALFKELAPAHFYKSKTAVVFTNHVYRDTNRKYLDPLLPYGGMWVSSGGEGVPFLASVRIFMYDPKPVKKKEGQKEIVIGKQFGGRVHKNKCGTPIPRDFAYHIHDVPYSYVSYPWDMVETALKLGVLEQRAHFFYYGGTKMADSRIELENRLANEEVLSNAIDEILRHKINEARTDERIKDGSSQEPEPMPEDAALLSEAQDDGVVPEDFSRVFEPGDPPDGDEPGTEWRSGAPLGADEKCPLSDHGARTGQTGLDG